MSVPCLSRGDVSFPGFICLFPWLWVRSRPTEHRPANHFRTSEGTVTRFARGLPSPEPRSCSCPATRGFFDKSDCDRRERPNFYQLGQFRRNLQADGPRTSGAALSFQEPGDLPWTALFRFDVTLKSAVCSRNGSIPMAAAAGDELLPSGGVTITSPAPIR